MDRGSGPYYYFPKLEGRQEAHLWNDVFPFAQETLGIPRGSVREDKLRESGDGFDGTLAAHPNLVPVARAAFDDVLGTQPNQVAPQRDDVRADAQQLIGPAHPQRSTNGAPVRRRLSVPGTQCMWLRKLEQQPSPTLSIAT
ncbi:MAG: hypothetical protein ACR2JY_14170 [Chloroflexota bacterium]